MELYFVILLVLQNGSVHSSVQAVAGEAYCSCCSFLANLDSGIYDSSVQAEIRIVYGVATLRSVIVVLLVCRSGPTQSTSLCCYKHDFLVRTLFLESCCFSNDVFDATIFTERTLLRDPCFVCVRLITVFILTRHLLHNNV